MIWSLSTRWAPLRDEAPDLDAVRRAAPPQVALARGLPARLERAVRDLALGHSVSWIETPWPDADVDRIDSEDRDLRGDAVKAATRTLESANSLECGLVVATVELAGDPIRFALDKLLSAAIRQGVALALRGAPTPSSVTSLLQEFDGAPLGWILDLGGPPEMAEAVGDRAPACLLPWEDVDLDPWRGRAPSPAVLDPGPGPSPEELHARAEELVHALRATTE